MTKIDIISGFLGAGKTTLIKKLIKEAFQGENLVLIENEFGEIGIDGGFMQDSGILVNEMNSGCICCSLVGDFGTALKEVLDMYHPDRIIIEPSGVGKLSDVIKAVENIAVDNDILLNAYVTVADAKKSKMYMKNFGEFYNNQIQNAKTIILSRTDDISDEKIDQCVLKIRELNPSAVIITTPWDNLDGKLILDEMEKNKTTLQRVFDEDVCSTCGHVHTHEGHDHEEHRHDGHHHMENDHDEHERYHHEEHDHDNNDHEEHHHEEHHHDNHSHDEHIHTHGENCSCGHNHEHHADEIFDSWGVETHRKYSHDELAHILETLIETDAYGVILRAKGMLSNKDGNWMNFDMVPEEYEIREGIPMVTGRICVIGSNINKEKLAELFMHN